MTPKTEGRTLSKLESRVYNFIIEGISTHGTPPSGAQIGRGLSLSRQYASTVCTRLELMGYLERRGESSLFWPTKEST